MSIDFACPSCTRRYSVPDSRAGVTGRCPGCSSVLTVPVFAPKPSRSLTTDRLATWGFTAIGLTFLLITLECLVVGGTSPNHPANVANPLGFYIGRFASMGVMIVLPLMLPAMFSRSGYGKRSHWMLAGMAAFFLTGCSFVWALVAASNPKLMILELVIIFMMMTQLFGGIGCLIAGAVSPRKRA